MKRIFILHAILILLTSIAFGQEAEKKQYRATQITTPPVIDGILDEDVWSWNASYSTPGRVTRG